MLFCREGTEQPVILGPILEKCKKIHLPQLSCLAHDDDHIMKSSWRRAVSKQTVCLYAKSYSITFLLHLPCCPYQMLVEVHHRLPLLHLDLCSTSTQLPKHSVKEQVLFSDNGYSEILQHIIKLVTMICLTIKIHICSITQNLSFLPRRFKHAPTIQRSRTKSQYHQVQFLLPCSQQSIHSNDTCRVDYELQLHQGRWKN